MNSPSAPHFTREELRQIAIDLDRVPTMANHSARAKLAQWSEYDNDPNTKAFSEPSK
jgi:hypothetical protein